MMTTAQIFPTDKRTFDAINGLVETWLWENEVPAVFHINIPLILLHQTTVEKGEKRTAYSMGILCNHSGGNC
jgi:hypothetical protein